MCSRFYSSWPDVSDDDRGASASLSDYYPELFEGLALQGAELPSILGGSIKDMYGDLSDYLINNELPQ